MKVATRIALFQLVIGLLAAVSWALIENPKAGLAAGSGGGIAALLTLYAGLKTFGVRVDDPQVAVRNFYRAQMRKLLLAVVLFAVAVKLFGNNFVPLIATFAVSLSVYWFALLWDT
ncbi:MAG: ATP synthase subunit I [Nevskia sp.]|jgi:ATP synthase protein I|nr:ATP synthase subunit I [Nevskia sp.]